MGSRSASTMLMIRFVAPAGNQPEYGSRCRIFFRRLTTRGSSVFPFLGLPELFLFLTISPPDAIAIHMAAWASSVQVSRSARWIVTRTTRYAPKGDSRDVEKKQGF